MVDTFFDWFIMPKVSKLDMDIEMVDVERAMNLIKEEVIKDLSESVIEQTRVTNTHSRSISNVSLYEND